MRINIIENSTPLLSLNVVALDSETTGLLVANDRVLQIGAVPVRDGRILSEENWETLVNPGIPIPPKNSEIHGITDDMVADAKSFAAVAEPLQKMLSNTVVVGHHIDFDIAIFDHEFRRIGKRFAAPRVLDTSCLARIANPHLGDYSLDAVSERFGIEIENRHSALGDAHAAAVLYLKLIPMLREKGILTLAEAERLSDPRARSRLDTAVFLGAVSATARRRVADTYSFHVRVRDVMSSPAVTLPNTATIAEATKLLSDRSIGSAIVSATNTNTPLGIVTERDLMRVNLRSDITPAAPVTTIMGAPLITIEQNRFLYRAMGRMRAHDIEHLGVVDERGTLVGALSLGDTYRDRTGQTATLCGHIEDAKTVHDLAAIWGCLPSVVRALQNEDTAPSDLTILISEQLGAFTRRAFQMAEQRLIEQGEKKTDAQIAVFLLGDGGRGESLLNPQQKNALLYEPFSAEAESWFTQLSRLATDLLHEAGIPHCPDGIMARRSHWRGTQDNWREQIYRWTGGEPPAPFAEFFFDFTAVHGDTHLPDDIETYAIERAKTAAGQIARSAALSNSPVSPFTIIGTIATHEDRLDLAATGLNCIVDSARYLALSQGISRRGTKERLNDIRNLGIVQAEMVDAAIEAHELFLGHILVQQLDDLDRGIPPSCRIVIPRLSKTARERLKFALRSALALKKTTENLIKEGS
jgi:CBS domain-containing protein